jgi:murein DD-endopeptidase MepM/ murein hydrolase activator NlpD
VGPVDGGIRIVGDADDAGLVVVYTGVRPTLSDGHITRGEAVGEVPRTGDAAPNAQTATVFVGVTVDGKAVDAAPLLRAAAGDDGGAVAGAMVRPVLGATATQEFGCTAFAAEPVDPGCPGGHFHSGIDLAAPIGTPVQAAAGGTARVVADRSGYGLHVIVDDGVGLATLYAHLDSALVASGDRLPAGGLIGTVGSSGNSTGPHLHFEVRRVGVAEDPRRDLELP